MSTCPHGRTNGRVNCSDCVASTHRVQAMTDIIMDGMKTDILYALCVVVDDVHIAVPCCPFCGERHLHGRAGARASDKNFGDRESHCFKGTYILINGNRLKDLKKQDETSYR
jgi:hypothetical protein